MSIASCSSDESPRWFRVVGDKQWVSQPLFIHDLGIWVLLIFLATILGCYLPYHIIHGRRFIPPWRYFRESGNVSVSHESIDLSKRNERHEKSMSFLMSFSAGVCLAVGFVFQASGFISLAQLWKGSFLKANQISACILALTFCTFFRKLRSYKLLLYITYSCSD